MKIKWILGWGWQGRRASGFFFWNCTFSNLDRYIFVADLKINAVTCNPVIKIIFLEHKFICSESVIHPPQPQFELCMTFLSIPFFISLLLLLLWWGCLFVFSFDWPHVYFGEGDGQQTWAKSVSSSVFASRSSLNTGTRIAGLEALSSFVSARRNVRRVTKIHEAIE